MPSSHRPSASPFFTCLWNWTIYLNWERLPFGDGAFVLTDPSSMEKHALIVLVGGSSVIAQALAQIHAKDGWTVILSGRNNWELDVAAADTAIRHGTTTRTLPMDANDSASVDAAAAALLSAGPPPHE
jgi:hypothetical protein